MAAQNKEYNIVERDRNYSSWANIARLLLCLVLDWRLFKVCRSLLDERFGFENLSNGDTISALLAAMMALLAVADLIYWFCVSKRIRSFIGAVLSAALTFGILIIAAIVAYQVCPELVTRSSTEHTVLLYYCFPVLFVLQMFCFPPYYLRIVLFPGETRYQRGAVRIVGVLIILYFIVRLIG